MTDTPQARSFDEWFKDTWTTIVKATPTPGLDEIKNRLWLALDEKEELACPHCGRKFPGDAQPYSVVTDHGYKCKKNPAREVAVLLMELWNANVMALQDIGGPVDTRAFEKKVAPMLARWGFGAAPAHVDQEPVIEEPEQDPNYPIQREQRCYRKDSQYPNHGTVKNHVRVGPSGARVPAYCVEWEDGEVSNIKVEDASHMQYVKKP